jgi:hypothetical protein
MKSCGAAHAVRLLNNGAKAFQIIADLLDVRVF